MTNAPSEKWVTGDAYEAALHKGRRFPLCEPSALAALFRAGGLTGVETGAL